MGGINLYSCAGNNPINYIDPYGLWKIRISIAYGWGATLSFGSEHGIKFFDVTGAIGYGGGFSYSPNSSLPTHLDLDSDEIESVSGGFGFECGTGAAAHVLGADIGYQVYAIFGFKRLQDGSIVGSGEPMSLNILGGRKPGLIYAEPNYDFSFSYPFGWGVQTFLTGGVHVGGSWR